MKKIFQSIGSDLSSSIVVFLVALPLCLGIALGSNAPMFAGIIGGIVGGIVIGSLSGSHLSVSGPAAGLTVIVAAGIARLPTFEAFLLAVLLAGVFQIILGFVKAGVIGDYIPSSVITGMLAAIGLILILKQIPHFLGYNVDYEGDEAFEQKDHGNTFSGIIRSLRNSAPLAIIIGTLSLLIQLLWEKVLTKKWNVFKFIPAPLVVVLSAVGINLYFMQQQHPWALQNGHLVNVPVSGSVKEFVTFFTSPDFSFIGTPAVWTTALTIAIVASLETLLNIEAADELDVYNRVTPTNRELKAQGVGNVISGLIGGLPLTSVIVRTSANINSGAKTKMSAILHGVMLLLSAAFLSKWLNLIPLSALAAVLIYTGFKLAKPPIFMKFYRKGFDQFAPFVITIVAILFTDLLSGILIGIAAGLFFVLRSNFRTSVLVVHDENKYLVRLRKDVSFLNKPILKSKLEQVPSNSSVLIDAVRADFIDKDIIEVINDFLHHAHLKNIRVEIKKSTHKPVHQLIEPEPKDAAINAAAVPAQAPIPALHH
ncbi:MAG: SulP family inorganic anion transporter [Williamsia sp.]|nr:SulP family inorganic anion transporter [Williamsia sp.]